MKTLTTPVATSAAAQQSGWVELYDFYLSASIVTPWGTTNTIRLCTLPNGFSFFAPIQAPESAATQGSVQTYQYWPLKREVAKGDTKFQDDKLRITASNVTSQFAALLALVNWYDTPVVIRKVPLFQAGLTANDCTVIFSGLVDSVDITAKVLQFTCSSSLGTLNYLLPSENMHAACRFRYGDDQCTQIKYRAANYVAGTCSAGCTVSDIISSAFTQDTGSKSTYGTDLVNALSDSAISASSAVVSTSSLVNKSCYTSGASGDTVGNPVKWVYCSNSLPNLSGTSYSDFTQVMFSGTMPTLSTGGTLTAGQAYYICHVSSSKFNIFSTITDGSPDIIYFVTGTSATFACSSITPPGNSGLNNAAVTVDVSNNWVYKASHGQSAGTIVYFAGTTLPSFSSTVMTAGKFYYIISSGLPTDHFKVSATSGGSAVTFTAAGTAVTVSTNSNPGPFGVKAQYGTGWTFTTAGDWGTSTQGYWQIPDAQAGLKNAALKPYIQFNFGSAVSPKLWQVSSFSVAPAEERVRLIEFFSSTDVSTWTFEAYFEMPNIGGQLFDVLIPTASTAQYWRICVRSRWAETLYYNLFQKVLAFGGSRNWWLAGQITFTGNVTAALAGKTVAVRGSFAGEILTAPLPVAPAAGDAFTIRRGCGRTFNACCARLNTENYGGFNDLELQNIINVFKA